MAGLADLVLGAGQLDEFEIEDADLLRELEELRALQVAANPESVATSILLSEPATTPATIVAPSTLRNGYGDKASLADTISSLPGGKASLGDTISSVLGGKASLADTILSAPGGVDDVDREFQAMERELQKQLQKYKDQCQEAEPTPDASKSAGYRPSSKSSAPGQEQIVNSSQAEELGDEVITPELLNLRAEATRMDEVFPETVDKSQEASARTRNRRVTERVKRAACDARREEMPENAEMSDLKQILSSLNVRMSAIQQKQTLQDAENTPHNDLAPATARAIAELKAQNAHLRERFQASGQGKRGLLQIDPSVFGVVEKPTRGAEATPKAGIAQESVQ